MLRCPANKQTTAVVVRTGYQTAKGRLVHSILYPKPLNMRLMRDAYRFVGVLSLIAVLGFIYSMVLMVSVWVLVCACEYVCVFVICVYVCFNLA